MYASAQINRVFKIVLVGDSGVGKTTFIRNFCLGEKGIGASSTVGEMNDYQLQSLEWPVDFIVHIREWHFDEDLKYFNQ